MSFNAYKRIRDGCESALTDDLPDILATVAAEQSITLAAPRKVYRHTRSKQAAFPACVVGQVRAEVNDDGGVMSIGQLPVMVMLSGSDPDAIDAQMDGYITALGRLFAGRSGDDITYKLVGFDADQPTPMEGVSNLVQTGAVLISATVTEAR